MREQNEQVTKVKGCCNNDFVCFFFFKKDACRIQNRLVSVKAQCVIIKGR